MCGLRRHVARSKPCFRSPQSVPASCCFGAAVAPSRNSSAPGPSTCRRGHRRSRTRCLANRRLVRPRFRARVAAAAHEAADRAVPPTAARVEACLPPATRRCRPARLPHQVDSSSRPAKSRPICTATARLGLNAAFSRWTVSVLLHHG